MVPALCHRSEETRPAEPAVQRRDQEVPRAQQEQGDEGDPLPRQPVEHPPAERPRADDRQGVDEDERADGPGSPHDEVDREEGEDRPVRHPEEVSRRVRDEERAGEEDLQGCEGRAFPRGGLAHREREEGRKERDPYPGGEQAVEPRPADHPLPDPPPDRHGEEEGEPEDPERLRPTFRRRGGGDRKALRPPRPTTIPSGSLRATDTSAPVPISTPIVPSRIPSRYRYAGRKMKITE